MYNTKWLSAQACLFETTIHQSETLCRGYTLLTACYAHPTAHPHQKGRVLVPPSLLLPRLLPSLSSLHSITYTQLPGRVHSLRFILPQAPEALLILRQDLGKFQYGSNITPPSSDQLTFKMIALCIFLKTVIYMWVHMQTLRCQTDENIWCLLIIDLVFF